MEKVYWRNVPYGIKVKKFILQVKKERESSKQSPLMDGQAMNQESIFEKGPAILISETDKADS